MKDWMWLTCAVGPKRWWWWWCLTTEEKQRLYMHAWFCCIYICSRFNVNTMLWQCIVTIVMPIKHILNWLTHIWTLLIQRDWINTTMHLKLRVYSDINTVIHQGFVTLIKSDSKDINNDSVSNKCCSSELSIHLWIMENKMHHGFHKKYFVFNIDNNQKCFLSSKSAYYYDFWRSCDTEDCSNDAENTALITEINYSLIYIKIKSSYFK